ncbi:CAP domain-containing protein [Streptomyces sp. NRRL S-244]|uniref:CAP domain-containing protein n=1 Tax=Streptomyces sp. NRRL S-244 TaxID=1463897 RepID=UPI0004C1D354|nr:CAP domain-containing protein [Streptomyces sp. NRRL S-244]
MRNLTRVHHRAGAFAAAALMAGGAMFATGATATVAGSAVRPAELSPAQEQAILAETNTVRQQADQPPLTWDSSLAEQAQAWADDPASTAGGELTHAPVDNAAENMSGYPPDQATGSWATEKSAYDADPDHDYESNPAGYRTWGHYYNMIDAKWHKMGCGAKSGVPIPGGGWVVVCRYGG